MALTILSQPDLITSLYSIDGDNLSFVLESTMTKDITVWIQKQILKKL